MSRPDLVVVACGNRKLPGRHRARDLYTGPYFRAAMRYADSTGSPILIISAKFGLVRPFDLIDSYDVTMGDPGSVDVATVRAQAERLGLLAAQRVECIGGKRYVGLLRSLWPTVTNPAGGTGQRIGRQLASLKRLAERHVA